jgi:hypothetical protein
MPMALCGPTILRGAAAIKFNNKFKISYNFQNSTNEIIVQSFF